MKTSDLTGNDLDWAVGVAEGEQLTVRDRFPCVLNAGGRWNPSSSWSLGGPIIEREGINLYWMQRGTPDSKPQWVARKVDIGKTFYGETPLVAAMRCFVYSKLGDEIDIPAILPDSTC